ncbi:TRAF-type zinc finger domain-containing protein 1 [Protopterus annectens]|uniref:TRAF-type zinc finger domain-containing protein 1 n=1 Tax=Protopterus annectens TaxID=7888 RepID=UPI001CFB422B|nr:TRAF-type zinc finger domain-containing protein 1 [Protopterus annectens]
MSSSTENEVQLCGNCKKEIPTANFTIHEIHCWRNIALCQICSEPFPKSEMKEHLETEHTQVTCRCNLKMDRSEMENHKISECPLRLVKCKYCELELCFDKLSEHDSYCGARTEPCSICGSNVMVKDLDKHPEVCGKTSEINNNKIKSNPLHHLERDAGAWFEEDHFGRILSSMSYRRPAHQVMLPHMRTFRTTLDVAAPRRRIVKPAVHQRTMDQNQVDEQERIQKNRGTFGEENSNLDYMLALSLQSETNSGDSIDEEDSAELLKYSTSNRLEPFDIHGVLREKENTFPVNALRNVKTEEKKSNDTMLPCEFCEELFPEEDLLVHQTGCNTVSAFSSFTKKSSNPQVQLDHGGVFQSFPQSPSDQDVLDDAFESTYFGPSEPAEDNIVIPCEFCGTLLEEEVLFHHQDKCDFRHATTRSIERPSAGHCAPKWENTERRKPSETGHRKHQEDFDGSYLDSVSPCKPIRTVARIPAKSVSVSRTAPQKFSPDVTGGSSTFKNPSRKGTFTTQVGTETQNNKNPSEFKQSTYTSNGSSRTLMEKNDPNFSRASPHRGRPSLKTEVSRNPRTTAASNLRMHPTKVNSKKPHVDDSDNTDE